MGRPAALLALLSGIGLAALTALLFLGGQTSAILPPVGEAIFPPGSIHLALPKDGDIACPGTGDDPCHPTPVPTIDPAAAAEGVALRVLALDVRLDHVGDYSILVGTATLPNGVLTEADAILLDEVHPELDLRNDTIRLAIIGGDGESRGNTWSDGWRPGLEQVEVRLEFTVKRLDRPVTLELSDIVVH